MSKLKKNKTLPVHIVEQHNDVVPFIHRAIASKLLQFTEIPIIHLDSHPDLLIPINMQADLVFQPQSLFQSISIENWLLPLAYAKHISHIVWVKPPWANQIQASEQEFTIGKSVQSGKIRLSCKENYFLTDGLFSKVEGLTDTSKVKLTVVELAPKNWEELPSSCAASSSSSSDSHSGIFRSYKEWTHHLQDAVQSKPYILDIDLDFFSTANPFKNWLGPEEEEVVRQLYHCPSPSDLSDEMEFWKPPQPSVTHDPRQNKRQGPNIIDSFGVENTPMLLTRQKEPVSILVTENAHMGEELGQDGTELATAIVQAKIVQKLPVVEVEHRTYHAGCYNRKCWMWFFIFLLQFTGLRGENCTVWKDHSQYLEVFSYVLNIGLSSHYTIECPHGCCGEWRDICCDMPKVEPPTPKEEPANETLDQAEIPDVNSEFEQAAEQMDISYDKDLFNLIAVGILLCFAVIFGIKKRNKRGKPF